MAQNLLIGRVTEIWRQTRCTVERARSAMEVKHVRPQVITSLTSDDARCVLLWNSPLGEGRELDSIRWRHIIALVEALLWLAGGILNSNTILASRIECHHASDDQIGPFV